MCNWSLSLFLLLILLLLLLLLLLLHLLLLVSPISQSTLSRTAGLLYFLKGHRSQKPAPSKGKTTTDRITLSRQTKMALL
jgi:hypothetical protein